MKALSDMTVVCILCAMTYTYFYCKENFAISIIPINFCPLKAILKMCYFYAVLSALTTEDQKSNWFHSGYQVIPQRILSGR